MKECIEISCSNEATFRGRCKPCQAKFRKEYRERAYVKEQERLYAKKNHKENKEKNNAVSKLWRENNKERNKELKAEWYKTEKGKAYQSKKYKEKFKKNPEKFRLIARLYREENREVCRLRSRKWRINNLDKGAQKEAKRRSTKLKATVKWSNKEAIEAIYLASKELTVATGIKHQVDHIIPLKGRLVCGLHTEDNLQILTASDNLLKSNSFIV